MAWTFGDGFDVYAATGDSVVGYWDSGTTTLFTLNAGGRFAGSQCIASANLGAWLVKSSGANDAVHHVVCAFRQTGVLSGSTLGLYLQFTDGSTNQCCIVFRSDGAILLTSATPAGTVLDTYTGAVSAQNTWFAFEFEVTINNTTGSWAVRKNGNTSNDRATGGLNTRPGTNSYANKLTIGQQTFLAGHQIDDLLWRSDSTSVPWVGDIRCYTRMPSTTVSAQFTVAPNPFLQTQAVTSSSPDATATSRYSSLVPQVSGTIGSIVVQITTGFTGNLKCTIFADNASNPGAVLGSATTLANPVNGANTMTFSTPVAVTRGVQYWWGVSHDVTASVATGPASSGRTTTAVAYAAFPSANPGGTTITNGIAGTANITPSNNADFVNETLQDGTTSYVYDSTVGHADFYNIATLSGTPSSVVAVTVRGFLEKSDAGTRNGAVQLKSGGTTVQSPAPALSTSWGWLWRTDTIDPNTTAPWTPIAVNAVQIGPIVTV